MAHHHLTPEYCARMSKFVAAFPSAHAFLARIESNGPLSSMWLSTAVNAHLYKGDAFLAYLKLKNPELKPPSLVVSPNFNQQIAAHTTDESMRLFPHPFDDVVATHGGFTAAWAVRHAQGATEFTSATPGVFFDELFEALVGLSVAGAGRVQ